MITYPTTKPESPAPGDIWIDIDSNVVNMFTGDKWFEYNEEQMIVIEMKSLLSQAGHTPQEVDYMLNVLRNTKG